MTKVYRRRFGIYRFFRTFKSEKSAVFFCRNHDGAWRVGISNYISTKGGTKLRR